MAEADPERMMADTEAWRSRHLNVKEFELQRPLYSINTYTDTQVRHDNIYPLTTFSFVWLQNLYSCMVICPRLFALNIMSQFPIDFSFHLEWDRPMTHEMEENYASWLAEQTMVILLLGDFIHYLDLKATQSISLLQSVWVCGFSHLCSKKVRIWLCNTGGLTNYFQTVQIFSSNT